MSGWSAHGGMYSGWGSHTSTCVVGGLPEAGGGANYSQAFTRPILRVLLVLPMLALVYSLPLPRNVFNMNKNERTLVKVQALVSTKSFSPVPIFLPALPPTNTRPY